MEKISQEYFFLQESPNLHIIHTDGRYYLNTSEKKYDVILSDAFSGLRTTPFQLTTIEAVQAMYNRLNDDGVVVENLISAIE
jgi:spermidine synthase